MFPFYALLSLILATSTAVDASAVSRSTGKATLSFATKINEHGTLSIVEKDRARVQAMKQQSENHATHSINVTNAVVSYTAQVGIGNPPVTYTLLVDTGCANTWVGAGKPYIKTSTSQSTGNSIAATYLSGYFSGEEWTDTVTLSPDLVASRQPIGVASSHRWFTEIVYDGILGVGPVDLLNYTVNGVDKFPTLLDKLFSQGKISKEVLGVYFVPFSEPSSIGELTFGGYDESAIVSRSPVYTPLTTAAPSYFWSINQSIRYGHDTIMSSTSGIIDSGTALIYIASDAFKKYQSMTGATLDKKTNLPKITPNQYAKLQPLTFNIGGEPFVLTPNAQIWPRSLNTVIGGSSNEIYFIIHDIGYIRDEYPAKLGSGINFINGYKFLERYYSVYDARNRMVGFAPTKYTHAEIN